MLVTFALCLPVAVVSGVRAVSIDVPGCMGVSGDGIVPRGSWTMDSSVSAGGTPVDDADTVVVCICDETIPLLHSSSSEMCTLSFSS